MTNKKQLLKTKSNGGTIKVVIGRGTYHQTLQFDNTHNAISFLESVIGVTEGKEKQLYQKALDEIIIESKAKAYDRIVQLVQNPPIGTTTSIRWETLKEILQEEERE